MERRLMLVLTICLFGTACSGSVGGGDKDKGSERTVDDPNPTVDPDEPIDGPKALPPKEAVAARASVRRLTAVEATNAITDIFWAKTPAAAPASLGLADSAIRHTYDTEYQGLDVNTEFAEALGSAADKVADALKGNLAEYLPCAKGVTSANEAQCAAEFIKVYGRRLFRAPVSQERAAGLQKLFATARGRSDFATSISVVTSAMLHSPAFLFRTELGSEPGKAATSLEPFELASAISFFLWRSTPDDALLDAAQAGKLGTRAGIQEEARRLLQHPKSHRSAHDFIWQWLEINTVAAGLSKEDAAYTPQMVASILEETTRLIDDAVWTQNAKLATLLTSTDTFANSDVATIYKLSGPASKTFQPVKVDARERSGLLTTPAFSAAHSAGGGFNPIFPGAFIRKKVFCQALPPAPGEVPAPSKDPNMTTRERFAVHSDSSACRSCHELMDPIGFAFERYDVLGRFLDSEEVAGRKVPLTGKGTLTGTDVDGDFVGVSELAQRLASSFQVKECFAAQMLEFALGRDTGEQDERTVMDTTSLKQANPGDATIQDLMVALLTTDSFLYRNASQIPGAQP